MQLYMMELFKISRKKIAWCTAGIAALMIFSLCGEAYGSKDLLLREFGAAAGYWKAMEIMQFSFTFLSIWLIVVLSFIFAEDNVDAVRDVITSTERGREGVYFARVKAAFTIAVLSYLCVAGSIGAVCGWIYGYRSGDMQAWTIYPQLLGQAQELSDKSIIFYFGQYLLVSFGAVVMLTAFLIWISSCSKTVVHVLCGALAFYLIPTVVEAKLSPGSMDPLYVFMTGQPVLLVVQRCLHESWHAYGWHVGIIIAVTCMGIWCGKGNWVKTRTKSP